MIFQIECGVCGKRFFKQKRRKYCSTECYQQAKKIKAKQWRQRKFKNYLREWRKQNKEKVREWNKQNREKFYAEQENREKRLQAFNNLKLIKKNGWEAKVCEICGKRHYRFLHRQDRFVSLCKKCFYDVLYHGLEVEI